jgi:flagellar biosynthesis protein FlhG
MTGQIEKLQKILGAQETRRAINKNIIAFSSGKGGTGKTFISVNVAHSLAHKGYRVLFIDFDSNLSNADILLNISPRETIVDYFLGKNLLENVITKGSENIDYIFGDSGRLEFPKLNIDLIGRFVNGLDRISNNYDYVVVDTGAGINNEITYLLSKVHVNVFVTTPEPTSIMDTYAAIKMLFSKSKGPENYVIINLSDSDEQALEAFNNLNTALSHFLKTTVDFLGFINFDRLVRKSIIDQTLLLRSYPKSEVACQIRAISTKLAGCRQMANINQI